MLRTAAGKQRGNTCCYFERGYDTKRRFISYWHQIDEVLSLEPREVLEVGIGNGMVSRYLRGSGLKVITLDIMEELSPDIIASVMDMPFEDGAFDVVACYEVLEHIEYAGFTAALNEICRVCRRNAVISLPDQSKAYRLLLKAPFVRDIQWMVSVPRVKDVKDVESGHKWEIGCREYPLDRIICDMREAGFSLSRTYRVFEHPYHRFFVLEKIPPDAG